MAPQPSTLLERVNDEVEKVRQKWGKRLPGLTVALAKDGKIVLAKGYGNSNIQTGADMTPDTPSPSGSMAKATCTGPAVWKLLKDSKEISRHTKLYGPQGLFNGDFDEDIKIGVRRHSPIIDVAIAPDNRCYAWYVDGTFSVGTSTNLSEHEPRKSFKVAEGKTLNDICGIAISKGSLVYTWYMDGTISLGHSYDLGAKGFSPETIDKSARAKTVDGKRRQSMEAIVGIDFAKSNDHVYVWYEDGSVSSGYSANLGRYSDCQPFTCEKVPGGSQLEIRGVGISKDDIVYTWFGNGKVSHGTSTFLDKFEPIETYHVPSLPDGEARWSWDPSLWFQEITPQHLLDHKAGFKGDGEIGDAARMFGVQDESKLTYEQLHRHFLRTKKLLWRPGKYQYANQNLGACTIIIERLSHKKYRDYVRDDYLKPFGLDKLIEPRSDPEHDGLVKTHWVPQGSDEAIPKTFESEEIELAAGGYRASAKALVTLMLKLLDEYKQNYQTIDNMGWINDGGRLFHNGSTGGGGSTASMYPPGFTKDGVDYGGVCVAVVCNVSDYEDTDLGSIHNDVVALGKTLAAQVMVDCTELRQQITALTSKLDALEAKLDNSNSEDPDDPYIKPPSGYNHDEIKKQIEELKQQLAAAKLKAKNLGCAT